MKKNREAEKAIKEVLAMDKALAAHRKKNFRVNIRPSLVRDDGENALSITHNGNHWNALSLNRDEMIKVRNRINEYLENGKVDK